MNKPSTPEDSEDVTEDTLREWLSGERMIHRLRDWKDRDTLYGVSAFNLDGGASTGKTFREGEEHGKSALDKARDRYVNSPLDTDVMVLYRATVRDPGSEGQNPRDLGEPPLKFATLTDVEILAWEDTTANSGGEDGD